MQSILQAARFAGTCSVGVHRPGLTHTVMLKRIALSPLVLIGAALAVAAPAQAQRQPERAPFELSFQRGDGLPSSQWDVPRRERSPEQQVQEIPLSEILRRLKAQHGGRHLDARRQGDVYVISWLTEDGKRLTFTEPATRSR